MKTRKYISLATIGLMTTAAVGCSYAKKEDVDAVRAEAAQARRTADEAISTARDAEQRARAAESRAQLAEESVSRGFKKSMRK